MINAPDKTAPAASFASRFGLYTPRLFPTVPSRFSLKSGRCAGRCVRTRGIGEHLAALLLGAKGRGSLMGEPGDSGCYSVPVRKASMGVVLGAAGREFLDRTIEMCWRVFSGNWDLSRCFNIYLNDCSSNSLRSNNKQFPTHK